MRHEAPRGPDHSHEVRGAGQGSPRPPRVPGRAGVRFYSFICIHVQVSLCPGPAVGKCRARTRPSGPEPGPRWRPWYERACPVSAGRAERGGGFRAAARAREGGVLSRLRLVRLPCGWSGSGGSHSRARFLRGPLRPPAWPRARLRTGRRRRGSPGPGGPPPGPGLRLQCPARAASTRSSWDRVTNDGTCGAIRVFGARMGKKRVKKRTHVEEEATVSSVHGGVGGPGGARCASATAACHFVPGGSSPVDPARSRRMLD